jgi:hypothetical protein
MFQRLQNPPFEFPPLSGGKETSSPRTIKNPLWLEEGYLYFFPFSSSKLLSDPFSRHDQLPRQVQTQLGG